ncbi:MAG: DUF3048 domain-containing protein [Blautia sp.]|nr:DUF3048 domain-containing protein [Blautia sp.]
MRRKILGLLAGVMALASVFGTTAGVLAEETASGGETMVKSYLTGEDVPERIGRRRPVAVMMGNTSDAAPQSGIANAGVVFEAPVEAEITRLMSVIEDYDDLERIGSVRSCRDSFIFYAYQFNAIYAHYGQSIYALKYLENHNIENLNGIKMGSAAFYRTSDRSAPHNAYTSGDLLKNGIEQMGYSTEYREDYEGHFQFSDEEVTLDGGEQALTVRLNNFKYNKPWFEYDEATKKYKRFQFGDVHIDEVTGEQLTCDNIILQYSEVEPYDAKGYLKIDAQNGGYGKYVTRGKAIDVFWYKNDPWGPVHYQDSNGQEIEINTGKTWIEIIHSDRTEDIVLE